MLKVMLEFKLADLWVGVFWKRTPGMIPIDFDRVAQAEMWGKEILTTDVWICVVPCFPIHITWVKLIPPHDDHVTAQGHAVNAGILKHGRPDLIIIDDPETEQL